MAQKRKLVDEGPHDINKKLCKSDEGVIRDGSDSSLFMRDMCCYILQAGIQKVRMNIFKTQLSKFGGMLSNKITSTTTHVVVDETMERGRLWRLLELAEASDDVVIVETRWLSDCFKRKRRVDTREFEINMRNNLEGNNAQENLESPELNADVDVTGVIKNLVAPLKYPKVGLMFSQLNRDESALVKRGEDAGDSDYTSSDDETSAKNVAGGDAHRLSSKQLPVGNWICAQSSKAPPCNLNQHITDKLEEMVHTYETTNDKWRAFGYQKAIQALRKHPKQITTWEEAKDLPGVGKRLADKIWEIAESGGLRKLDEFKSSEMVNVINLFGDVWGAGPTTARAWYAMGFRILDDLRTKANLTKQQKIGLDHYYDFLDRMPYNEAGEIQRIVRERVESLQTGAVAVACGSYRRCKTTCGDVDVLVTHPDGHSHKLIFSELLTSLRRDGFLTDDLVNVEVNGNQKKYMGVCRLPGDESKYRRIDIIAVPHDEYACALMHFTGSAHFNRSIRHLAKKLGMSLSEHSLRIGVVRPDGEKTYGGTPVQTPSEESIFKFFGLQYREPEDRDH